MAQGEASQAIFADSLEAWRKRVDIYVTRIHYRRGETHRPKGWETQSLRRILSLRHTVDCLVVEMNP